jgi:hypothetical protein
MKMPSRVITDPSAQESTSRRLAILFCVLLCAAMVNGKPEMRNSKVLLENLMAEGSLDGGIFKAESRPQKLGRQHFLAAQN